MYRTRPVEGQRPRRVHEVQNLDSEDNFFVGMVKKTRYVGSIQE